MWKDMVNSLPARRNLKQVSKKHPESAHGPSPLSPPRPVHHVAPGRLPPLRALSPPPRPPLADGHERRPSRPPRRGAGRFGGRHSRVEGDVAPPPAGPHPARRLGAVQRGLLRVPPAVVRGQCALVPRSMQVVRVAAADAEARRVGARAGQGAELRQPGSFAAEGGVQAGRGLHGRAERRALRHGPRRGGERGGAREDEDEGEDVDEGRPAYPGGRRGEGRGRGRGRGR